MAGENLQTATEPSRALAGRAGDRFRLPAAASVAFAGGAAVAAFEALWVSRLGFQFGTTSFARLATACALILGAALGSWLIGGRAERSPRPARFLGLVVVGLGLLGWAAHEVFIPLAGRVNAALVDAGQGPMWLRYLVRFACSFAAVLPASLCVGGLVPAALRWAAADAGRLGQRTGLLAAAGLAGAGGGVLATRLWLIRHLAWALAPVVPGLVCVAVGGAVLARSRRPAAMPIPHDLRPTVGWQAGLALLLTGAVAAVALVLDLRTLTFHLGRTDMVTTALAAAVLAGLAAGAAVGSLLAERVRQPRQAVGLVAFSACLAIAAGAVVLSRIGTTTAAAHTGEARTPSGTQGLAVMVAVAAAPAIVFGMMLPLYPRLVAPDGRPARQIGRGIALVGSGCAMGMLVAALVTVPALGTRATFAGAVALLALVGVALQGRPPRLRAVGARAAMALVGLAAGFLLLRYAEPFRARIAAQWPSEAPVYAHRGPEGAVLVVENAARMTRTLLWNGVDLDDDSDLDTIVQWRRGLVPVLLHPDPKRVLMLGLGTGGPASAARTAAARGVDVVEPSPSVIRAARLFDPSLNGYLHEDPRVRLLADDGGAFLANTRQTYDVIIIDLTAPRLTGSTARMEAFYRLCVDRLGPQGVLCHWVAGWRQPPESIDQLASAFSQATHPALRASTWCVSYSAARPVIGLIARRLGPPGLSLARLTKRMADRQLASMLRFAGVATPLDLFAHHVADGLRLCAAPVTPGSPDLGTQNLACIQRAVELRGNADPSDAWPGFDDESWRKALAARRQAVATVLAGQMNGLAGDTEAQVARYAMVRELGWSDPVVACFERDARVADLLKQAQAGRAAGLLDTALYLARAAAKLDPMSANAYCAAALCLMDAGHYEQAAETAKSALDLEPAAAPPRFIIAAAFRRQGNDAFALGEVDQLLDLDPDHLEGHRLRMRILRSLRRLAEADREQRLINRLQLETREEATKWPFM